MGEKFHKGLSLLAILLGCLVLPNTVRAQAGLSIGEWDGVTASAKLDGPYEDPRQANVPFGIISYFNQPWRSYMDTWPASKYLEVPGLNWNVKPQYAEATCQVLQEAGIKTARYEIGWGTLDWNDQLPARFLNNMKTTFAAFQRHGIRPLILLNAHHGQPCPVRNVRTELAADAKQGDMVVKFSKWAGVRPGYTGFSLPRSFSCFPIITNIDADGTATLSAPLPSEVKAGVCNLREHKYQPFQGTKLKDGTPVPAAQETIDGWKKYVTAITIAARDALGTVGKPDAGFDLEVWNEYSFGSNFLDINRYYNPKLEYAEPFIYRKTREVTPDMKPGARTLFEVKGCEAILPITIDYVNDPANNLPGVHVISGFSNQSPWANGTEMWTGQTGFSRHYYTGGFNDVTPATPLGRASSGTIDALGQFDGKKDGKDWSSIEPGTNFIPTFRNAFPEFWHTGLKTENVSRDLVPDSRWAYMKNHGRYTHNGDFHPGEVWQTEVNYYRAPFLDEVCKNAGITHDDPRILPLAYRLAGKTLLRQYIFHAHKGFSRILIFAANAEPLAFGMLPPDFYQALDASNDVLTDDVRKTIPAEFIGLSWLNKLMSTGEPLVAPRPLQVKELVEYKPRLVFAGDGTPAHPSHWNRDQFAFLPFQLSANKYVIPYYVMTLDMTHSWDAKKDVFDPARYDMPEQDFDVTIGNIAGVKASVSAYDPLRNVTVPVTVVASTPTTLTVRLKTVDYPRILQISEAKPGPQILAPKVSADKDGNVSVSWQTNIPANAKVTYGRDWMNRSAVEVNMAPGKTQFSTRITTGMHGVVAVRIVATANGLTDVWPRWDEDPAGQVVIPAVPGKEDVPTVASQTTPRNANDFLNPLGQYNGGVLPTAARPAWQYIGTGSDDNFARIGAGNLAIDTTADQINRSAFRCSNWAFDENAGYTVEAKVQVQKYTGGNLGNDHGLVFQIYGPTQLMQIDISTTQLLVRRGTASNIDFANTAHVVRMVKHAGADLFDVLVDGKTVQANVPTTPAGGNRIVFGDTSAQRSIAALISYLRVDNSGAWSPADESKAIPLTTPVGIMLPSKEANATHSYQIAVPAGTVFNGEPDNRHATFAGTTLRVLYVPSGMRLLSDYLPVTSVTDTSDQTIVSWPNGRRGTIYNYQLDPAAHPGMVNTVQQYLVIHIGGDDALIIAASGDAKAMTTNAKTIRGIFASLRLGE